MGPLSAQGLQGRWKSQGRQSVSCGHFQPNGTYMHAFRLSSPFVHLNEVFHVGLTTVWVLEGRKEGK